MRAEVDEILDPLPSHGGKRQGAGRKPKDYVPPLEKQALDSAKARKEAAQANLAELDYKVKSGQYISRAAVFEASATVLSTLAQGLRSLPDNLERRFNLSPEVAEEIGSTIDAALNDVSEGLAMFADDTPSDV